MTLLARGRSGLDGAAADVRQAGGQALTVQTDVADPAQVDSAASQAEEAFGPIDVWINVAFTSVFAPVHGDHRGGVPARHRGVLPGLRATARSRRWPACDRATTAPSSRSGRRSASAASRCSRPTAAPSTPSTGSPSRCAASCCTTSSQRAHHRGADAGRQHPAVLLGAVPAAPRPAAGAAHLRARGGGARRGCCAADHPGRKQYWVGGSTAATLLAQKFAAPLLDRYLARTGFDSQQTDERVRPGRPDNLWEPVDEPPGTDHGAHGAFDDRSHRHSTELWLSRHSRQVLAVTGAALGVGGVLAGSRRWSR